jgi:hypothetical protein
MQFLGLIMGLAGIIGWAISLLPQLGWISWIFVPVALTGLVFCVIGMLVSFHYRGMGIAGIVICLAAIVLGSLRLAGSYGLIPLWVA